MFEKVIGRVNNAGVKTWKPLLDVTEEEWDLPVLGQLWVVRDGRCVTPGTPSNQGSVSWTL